jgi:hypothetical protein
VLRPGGHLVISDSRGMLGHLGPPVVKAVPSGGFGYLPHHTHLASDYLAAAFPLGLQVRGCHEPLLPYPVTNPDTAPARNAAPAYRPDDHWSLQAWCPAAANAAYRQTPIAIIWHFQIGEP